MTVKTEMHDPEMCYRRGYHQGTQQVFDAIKHHLPMRQSLIVHAWIAEDLLKWRVAALKGESKREPDGSTVMCRPPTKRLSNIGG
jgi:hypothetical protein